MKLQERCSVKENALLISMDWRIAISTSKSKSKVRHDSKEDGESTDAKLSCKTNRNLEISSFYEILFEVYIGDCRKEELFV